MNLILSWKKYQDVLIICEMLMSSVDFKTSEQSCLDVIFGWLF